ncbi:MAG: hypothetical protein ACLPWG_16465, partial [Steroidobacteraceae bacterium]
MPVNNRGREHGRISEFRSLLISTSIFVAVAPAINPAVAQTASSPGAGAATGQTPLPQIRVSGQRPKPRAQAKKSGVEAQAPPRPTTAPVKPEEAAPTTTPLNTNAVAASASRLGLTVLQTPASVEVQHTDRAFGDFSGGPIALVLHRLLIDDLDRCRRLQNGEAQT